MGNTNNLSNPEKMTKSGKPSGVNVWVTTQVKDPRSAEVVAESGEK